MSGIARLTRDSGQLLGMEQPNVHPLPSAAAPPTRRGLFDQTLRVTDDISIDVLRVWARDAAAFADVLGDQDPSWRSEWFALAGGRVVLCGAGLYVNHALAVGLDGPLTEAAWRTFEQRCAAVGVEPAFEVSPATAGEVVAQLVDRGYALDGARAAMLRGLDRAEALPAPDPRFVIEPANGELLGVWQVTSAAGWGHASVAARRASDAFARAAAVVDGEGLVVVRDATDGRPVGCASTTVTDRIATLGGMSTLPSERGRGVQAALIAHRLRRAVELGCEVATSSAAPDSGSERNLIRHGFDWGFLVKRYVRRQS
jgi:GNAT superfamily N-acetyltransferase